MGTSQPVKKLLTLNISCLGWQGYGRSKSIWADALNACTPWSVLKIK